MFKKRRGLFLLCILVFSLVSSNVFSQAVFAQSNSDKFKNAKSIKVGELVNGAIEKVGEKDYYVFKSNSAGVYIIRTMGNTDTFGCLYDSKFKVIKENDEGDSATGNFCITAVLEDNKSYYIEVQDYSNNGTGLYNLKVEKRDVLIQTYNEISDEKDKITVSFLIYNITKEPYDLKNLKLRYYLTNEMGQNQDFECIYASVGIENVVGSIKSLKEKINNADSYIEISYLSGVGTIDPGYFAEVKFTLNNKSKTESTLVNDYSYIKDSDYKINDCVTAYYKNRLIWGNEPNVLRKK